MFKTTILAAALTITVIGAQAQMTNAEKASLAVKVFTPYHNTNSIKGEDVTYTMMGSTSAYDRATDTATILLDQHIVQKRGSVDFVSRQTWAVSGCKSRMGSLTVTHQDGEQIHRTWNYEGSMVQDDVAQLVCFAAALTVK